MCVKRQAYSEFRESLGCVQFWRQGLSLVCNLPIRSGLASGSRDCTFPARALQRAHSSTWHFNVGLGPQASLISILLAELSPRPRGLLSISTAVVSG